MPLGCIVFQIRRFKQDQARDRLYFSSFQVSVIQYAVNPKFEFTLNRYKTKDEVMRAASSITQMSGTSTNTFHAIQYARFVVMFNLICVFDVRSLFVCFFFLPDQD